MTMRTSIAAAAVAASFTTLWAGTASATILDTPRAVSAFYTPDDGFMHAIVAQTDGSIREVYFIDQRFVASSVIARLRPTCITSSSSSRLA